MKIIKLLLSVCLIMASEKIHAQMKEIEPVQSTKLGVSSLPFSTAVKANGFLFLSGQIGIDQDIMLAGTFDLEVKQIFKNIDAILSEQKLTFGSIVSVTVYLKTMDNFKHFNDIYKTYFQAYYPTRTCVAVVELPLNANVEITITALTN